MRAVNQDQLMAENTVAVHMQFSWLVGQDNRETGDAIRAIPRKNACRCVKACGKGSLI
jgi:hypothetical protein